MCHECLTHLLTPKPRKLGSKEKKKRRRKKRRKWR
jgi:hypothetical protein